MSRSPLSPLESYHLFLVGYDRLDTHVCSRIAQCQTTGLGQYQRIGIAYPRFFQIEFLRVERDMRPFLDKFRVENKSVVAHAAIVEYLRIKHIQLPELRFDFLEVDAPLYLIFTGHHHFGHLYLIDTADKRRPTNQHLPFIPSVPGKSLSHHID